MVKSGKKLTDKFGKYHGQLVSKEEEERSKPQKISFSFTYFVQIKNFGIGNCSQNWFVGLIERLKTLSNLTKDQLLGENPGNKALRFHPIDWSKTPFKKSDLQLPKVIEENDYAFAIMQISISVSTGRIIGFFSDDNIFNIVLLDANHNAQPSVLHNYQIRPTTVGISQIDDLISKLKSNYKIDNSDINQLTDNNLIYATLDQEFYEHYQSILEKYSIEEIMEQGILALTE
ncbi:MAG: hypothetical protein IJ150_13215 [Bacteroidales bacterium]|nr:hypothetical protein [Bacteroidales bacterium]